MSSESAMDDVDDLNVFNDVTVIQSEEPVEEEMDVDEIAKEPPESRKIDRCKHCRRMKFGHPIPFGLDKCQLEKIENDEILKADDGVKNQKRTELRTRKKKRLLSNDKKESVAKKKKDEELESDEELKRMQDEEKELEAKLKKAEDITRKKKEQLKKNEDLRKKLENSQSRETKEEQNDERRNEIFEVVLRI